MMIIFLLIAFVAIYFIASYFTGKSPKRAIKAFTKPSALEILKERFANGEINASQYEEMKRVLMEEEGIYE